MDTPRKIPIHSSLNRHTLLMGGDRELVMSAGFIAGIMVFSLGTVWGVVLGIALWGIAVAILSRMGKADPLMRPVYIRHLKYQSYMPAMARFCGKRREIPLQWKVK